MLKHGSISLDAVQDDDIKHMIHWFNDINFLRNYDYESAVPYTEKKLKEYLDSLRESPEHMVFAIREHEDIIGLLGLNNILWNNGCASIFIGIGDSTNQSKGFGKIALSLLLNFAFNELNLYRLQLQVIEYNVRAINLYKSFHFIEEGIMRDFIHRDNKRFSLILYSLLRDEYFKE